MEEDNPKKITVGRVISWIICLAAVVIVVAVVVLYIANRDPSDIRSIVWTEDNLSSRDTTDDDFEILYQDAFDRDVYNKEGNFCVSAVRYMPSLNEWQFTLRSNTSMFSDAADEYSLADIPDSYDDFVFVLTDDIGHEYRAYSYIEYSRTRHVYRRFIFDDISGAGVSYLTLKIYISAEDEAPFTELPIFDSSNIFENYDYSDEISDSPHSALACFTPAD